MKAAKNQTELGAQLGVTQQAVSKLLRREDWPARRRGPWPAGDVKKLQAWHATLQEDRASDEPSPMDGLSAALKQMNILLKKEQREKYRLENEIRRGELVARDMLETSLGGLTDQFLRIFDEIRLTFPRRFKIDAARVNELMDAYQKRLVDRAEIEQRTVAEAIEASRNRRRGKGGGGSKR